MKQNKFNMLLVALVSCLATVVIYDKLDRRYVNPGAYVQIDKNKNVKYYINPKDKNLSEEYYEVDRFTYTEWIKGNDILIRR